RADESTRACRRDDVIFITARFRSGSTLLWNLFRHVPGCTAYYEPFNERCWFDAAARGDRVDGTHKHVDDYWREYAGLEELGKHYREEWIRRNLLMEADFWDPDMKRYIEILIERAAGRPVLQFNRVDFRLPWLRRNFPGAKLVHIYRHPRAQWCSTMRNCPGYTRDSSPSEFAACDRFYLRRWAKDLQYHFPFLADSLHRHAYETFYYLWRLSHLYGVCHAHLSLAYEQLADEPEAELERLFGSLDVTGADIGHLCSLVERPGAPRWPQYADDSWFREHEARCEEMLASFFEGPGSAAGPRLRLSHVAN
ncbi:MAG TPA: sulfotransferase, partial [Pirellulales bacterium]|nr:sulfotransferase [Pirellulales bacterium]